MTSEKKSTLSLNKETGLTNNIESQSNEKSSINLVSQEIKEPLSESTDEKKDDNSENNNVEAISENNEPLSEEKDKEVEEKLGNSIENTLKEIDHSIEKIEKKKKKKLSKKKSKKTIKSINQQDDKREEKEEEEEEENNNNIEENQENKKLNLSDEETTKIQENEDSFNEYGFSDSDIDYYDEPLIKDIMTPPIIDENSTFTWIPQLSDYIENVKQNLLNEAKKEQDELERDIEEKCENEGKENIENSNENKDEIEDEKKNENNESINDNQEEKKLEETKKENEVNKDDENKIEDDNIKILTDEELLKKIESNIDISNIIDVPILSFGINLSEVSKIEDITSEDEEEQELKEEENKKKHEEFMNETFEILRSETPINSENIDEFADYFTKGNEDNSQFDLDGSKNSIHSSKISFDEDGDNENKSKEGDDDKSKKKEEDGDAENEENSNEIDREQFIETLKLEIEKYERNNTKNLFLQNKLYELFRKKRPDEHRDGDKSMNDQEQRYLSSMYEYKELKNEYDDINNKKQEIANSYKEKLQEKKQESDKLYQDFYKQKQHVTQNAKSSRAGSEFSLKIFEQLEGLEKKKDEIVTAARLENIRLQNKLRRQESLLRQKEELADGLHLIDFEQLKIENQTYNEKIEERNEELLKLRKKINNIVQVLTHVKEKLQFVQAENVHLKDELKELDEKVTKQRDTLPAIKQSRDKLKRNTQILRQKHGLLGNRILLIDFENKVDETENLKRQVEELQVYHTELMLKRLSYKRKIKKSHIILAGC